MKPKFLTAVLLFISAYSPLLIILAVKDYDFNSYHFKHTQAITVLLSITTLSIILLYVFVASVKRGNMIIEVLHVKDRSVDLINYTIPYILSFFDFDLAKPEDVISLSIFLFIMLLLTIRTKSIFLNPLLALIGYGLYDVEYTFDSKSYSTIVISKHDLKTGDRFYVRKLTRFLYMTIDKINGVSDES